jgi:hypothetical protein
MYTSVQNKEGVCSSAAYICCCNIMYPGTAVPRGTQIARAGAAVSGYSPDDQLLVFARAKDGSTVSIIIRCAKILFAHVLRFQ